jgi:hypothetical protein
LSILLSVQRADGWRGKASATGPDAETREKGSEQDCGVSDRPEVIALYTQLLRDRTHQTHDPISRADPQRGAVTRDHIER